MKDYVITESRRVGDTTVFYGYSTLWQNVWRCWQSVSDVPGVEFNVQEFGDELSCYFAFIDRYYGLFDMEGGAA